MKRISSNIRCFRLDFRSAKYEIHTVRISRSVRLVKLSIHQMRVELLGNHILLSIPRKMEWIDPANGDSVSLHLEPIDITAGINLARSPSAGAVSTFLGTTRDNFEGKDVISLSYESYAEMAITSMQEICNKIRNQWEVTRIIVQHKLGDCPISDVSVLIAVSSPHRTESLKAVEFAINELKKTVPIWKKEIYDGGNSVWKENADTNPHAGVLTADVSPH